MVIMLYAPAISDALENKNVSLEELYTLRDHARSVLEQQGDLEGAIAKLEAEVRRRGSSA